MAPTLADGRREPSEHGLLLRRGLGDEPGHHHVRKARRQADGEPEEVHHHQRVIDMRAEMIVPNPHSISFRGDHARPIGVASRKIEDLRARVTELDAALGERSAEVARAGAGPRRVPDRYRHEVGLLHEELDRLELALAEAELGILNERLGETGKASPPPPPDASNRSRASRPTPSASCFATSPRRFIPISPGRRCARPPPLPDDRSQPRLCAGRRGTAAGDPRRRGSAVPKPCKAPIRTRCACG